MRGRPGTIAALGAAFAAALVIAGCGGGGGNQTTAPPPSGTDNAAVVAAAADATAKAGTARMAIAITLKTSATPSPQTVPITGTGSYDYKKRLGTLTLVLPAQFGGSVEEIINGNALYVRIPQLSPKYYLLDVNKVTDGKGTFSQLGNADPTATLETLRGASSDVQHVGTETIRGTKTAHYKGTLDMAKAAAMAPASVRQRLQQQLQTLKSVPFEAFIDDQGRLRKMTSHIVLSDHTIVDTSVELFDFGSAVQVTIPPKSQTTDGADLLRLLSGGAK